MCLPRDDQRTPPRLPARHALPVVWFWLQPPAAPAGEGWITTLIMLAVMVVFFYFFLIRPQRKRQQEHQAIVESLRRGDEVITIGGIWGRIVKVEKDHVVLQVNEEGTTVRVLKESVTQKEKAA